VIECQRDIWETAEPLIRRLLLPLGSWGVIYVRNYIHGESIAEEIHYPFYKATATDKQELLEQWTNGSSSWIIATGALGTGINIPGVIYIIYLGQPYGLTNFM
jgi:superfamily II DNA helicase RecQ